MLSQLRPALVTLAALTLLTGLVYPLAVTGLARLLFPKQANGSLIVADGGRVVGSELIGQSFTQERYFTSRPSAAGATGYDATASGGSNLAPTSSTLVARVREATAALRARNPDAAGAAPVDLVTASGSGLDPHLSPEAVLFQVPRIARLRGLEEAALARLIGDMVEGPSLGFLGESRVNVLRLNMALDALAAGTSPR